MVVIFFFAMRSNYDEAIFTEVKFVIFIPEFQQRRHFCQDFHIVSIKCL
jgi:hypothetical protein